MARRRKSTESGISLFPFLSILACVIGTLTLLIAGLALGQMSGVAPDVLEFFRLTRSTERKSAEHSRLRAQILQAEGLARTLADARAELERLESEIAKRRADEKTVVELLAAVDRLRTEIAALELELAGLEARITELRKLERRQTEADGKYALRSAGSGNVIPFFVECTSTGIVIAPEREESRQSRVSTDDIDDSRELDRLLKSVKSKAGNSVIFLVRPGGVPAFDAARLAALEKDVRFGYMPVPGVKPIGFDHLRFGNRLEE